MFPVALLCKKKFAPGIDFFFVICYNIRILSIHRV